MNLRGVMPESLTGYAAGYRYRSQESQRVTQAVPPEMNPADREKDRIDAMHEERRHTIKCELCRRMGSSERNPPEDANMHRDPAYNPPPSMKSKWSQPFGSASLSYRLH